MKRLLTSIAITLTLATTAAAQIQPVGSPWRRSSAGISFTRGTVTIDASGMQQRPLALTTNASVGNYNIGNSAIIMRDAAGEEIFRLWASDPDVLNNWNGGNLYLGREAGWAQPTTNDAGSGFQKTGMGYDSLWSTTSGANNSAFGFETLYGSTTGSRQSAFGATTLYLATTANDISGFGYGAGAFLTTGSRTTLIGSESGYDPADPGNAVRKIITDTDMVLVGYGASKNNAAELTNGIAIGSGAYVLESNQAVLGNDDIESTLLKGAVTITTGVDQSPLTLRTNGAVGNYSSTNSAIYILDAAGGEQLRIYAGDPSQLNFNSANTYMGFEAGAAQPSDNVSAAFNNSGYGWRALTSITTGGSNTAFGTGTLSAATTAFANSAYGAGSLQSNIVGQGNASLGTASLQNATANHNSAVGVNSLFYVTSGLRNSSVGADSGYNPTNDIAQYRITTDADMVLIGRGATKNNAAQLTNGIAIGSGAHVLLSNQAVLGNDSIVSTLLKGTVTLQASTATRSSLRVTPGVAPTAPVNGDIWVTTAGVFARVDGATEDLTDGGGAGGDDVSIDGVGVTNPDFVSTGDIDFVDTSNTITADINAGSIVTADINAAALVTEAEGLDSSDNDTSVPTTAAVIDAIAAGGGGGAPTDATYLTQTADGTLSAEQALSTLDSGIMRVATTTGVVTSLTDSAGIAANISDETGSGAMVFAAAPTLTGNVTVDQATGTANGLTVDADAFTTGVAIDASNANALTTGSIARFHSDSPDTGARNLVSIVNDNTAASAAVALFVRQDAMLQTARFVGGSGDVAQAPHVNARDFVLANNASAGMTILGNSTSNIFFGRIGSERPGRIVYQHSSDQLLFAAGGTITTNITANGVLPWIDSSYNLGADATRWENVYADNINTTTAVFSGDVDMSGLPTSDPAVAGRLWNDGGVIQSSGSSGYTLAGTSVTFADTNSDFTATTVSGAIEELVSVNGSGPNAADGKVDWSQLTNVPSGFADGTDDGAGGGSGTLSTIQEGGVQVGDQDITTLDLLGDDFDVSESPDTIVNVNISAALTRDTEWDTAAKINAATTDEDFLVESDAGAFGLTLLANATASDARIDLGLATDDDVEFLSVTAAGFEPDTDDARYLGKNDDDSPASFKGVILRDQTTGTYYRLEVDNGAISLVDLTD